MFNALKRKKLPFSDSNILLHILHFNELSSLSRNLGYVLYRPLPALTIKLEKFNGNYSKEFSIIPTLYFESKIYILILQIN